MKTAKFHNMNARIATGYGCRYFISYDTIVAVVKDDTREVWLGDGAFYSVTTARQLTRFLSEELGINVSGTDRRKATKKPYTYFDMEGYKFMYCPKTKWGRLGNADTWLFCTYLAV